MWCQAGGRAAAAKRCVERLKTASSTHPLPGRRRRPLRTEGHGIKDEDVARLSPLKDRHINFPGRCLFNIRAVSTGQGPHPFRDPDAVEDDKD